MYANKASGPLYMYAAPYGNLNSSISIATCRPKLWFPLPFPEVCFKNHSLFFVLDLISLSVQFYQTINFVRNLVNFISFFFCCLCCYCCCCLINFRLVVINSLSAVMLLFLLFLDYVFTSWTLLFNFSE